MVEVCGYSRGLAGWLGQSGLLLLWLMGGSICEGVLEE